MFEGKCLGCGAHYVGWVLRNPKDRTCSQCGAELEIVEHHETHGGEEKASVEKDILMAIEGECPRCGAQYVGWALRNPKYRRCNECDAELEIVEH